LAESASVTPLLLSKLRFDAREGVTHASKVVCLSELRFQTQERSETDLRVVHISDLV
jgi:hypothetical protein